MINWLKRIVAGKELDELERWRINWTETRKYLGEFPDAQGALDHLRQQVDGQALSDINTLRKLMRARRDVDETRARMHETINQGARLTKHRFKLDGGK